MSRWKGIFRECKNYPCAFGLLGFQSPDAMLTSCCFAGPLDTKIFCIKPNSPNKLSNRCEGGGGGGGGGGDGGLRLSWISRQMRKDSSPFKYDRARFNGNWSESYVSGNSFEDNKRAGNVKTSKQVPLLLCGFHPYHKGKSIFKSCIQQIRTFKPGKQSEAGQEKSENRFKSWIRSLLVHFRPKKPPNADIEEIMTLKNASNEAGAVAEDKERLKIAFAEGYMAGSRQAVQPATIKWIKKTQAFITIALLVGLFLAFVAGNNGSMFKMQLGKQIEIDPIQIHVTFDDVKGVDEAKQELQEVVAFLKNPEKFSILGGKLPKGVLLVGPPGTGKTLLARAVAGEAGVPFFHAAGPEFDEVLVGQGARRVRDLFKAAKENSPCVVFIDEIDSVGSKRTNSVLHPYANQTINQLLSEMDGFHQNEGIIVLGATNRRDDLDKALLRPGRFDVEVVVPIPDFTGRKEILEFYIRKILSIGIDVDMLARGTTGFTGADLENMVNQAALKAAIEGADHVTMRYLENARDKVLMGPERRNRIPDKEENMITAYHEGGHTIVGYYTKDALPLHKVTIIPRGSSLGHTAYIPERERYHVTKSQLLASMDTMMGGRAAEELIFGEDKVTSGSSSDLKQATSIATHMVKEWGMSEKVGLRTLDLSERSFMNPVEIGQGTNDAVDAEIKRILEESYQRAKAILKAHAREHKLLAEALLKYETLDADDIKAILMNKNPDANLG